MGYVHNTGMKQFIPPTTMYGTVAAWAIAAGAVAGTLAYHADATDESADCVIPIQIPSNENGLSGAYLKAIEIDFEILVAACDAVSAVVNKVTRGADGAVAVVAAQTFTYDSGHDTDAERLTLDQHRMKLTITTPIWVDEEEYVYVVITFDKAATTTIDVLAAIADFTLRI